MNTCLTMATVVTLGVCYHSTLITLCLKEVVTMITIMITLQAIVKTIFREKIVLVSVVH